MAQHLEPAELPVTEDDAAIADALAHASIPTLMMSLVHLTGDTSILRGTIRPATAIMGEMQGFMADEDKARIRELALEALKDYRDRGCTLPPPPSPETIHEMMSFMVGESVPAEYVPMMLEEMALDGEDSRRVDFSPVPAAKRAEFRTLVIGAGMSGVLMAIRLEEAGVEYSVVEKNAGIGGTWFENRYPGCRVDIQNHFYCYSFEPNHDWSEFFSQQSELQRYFDRCAAEYGVRDRIRFETEVVSMRFDEGDLRWEVVVRGPDGREQTERYHAVVSAVGQLNRPKIPEIKGLDRFAGPAFHSAAWEHEHVLEGKRIAVVGTGASALQVVPELGKIASHLTVFQRSAAWMFPNPNYHGAVSDEARWCLKHIPYYGRWYRFLIFWPGSDGLLPSLFVDEEWPHRDRSINAANDAMREIFTSYMKSQVGDDEVLLEKVIPRYPPFVKRMLQDNGSWLGTLTQDHVDLVTDGISEITEDAILCENGDRHPVDVIVFATGFHANRFLWPMDVEGRGGVKLREMWGEDPQAYLGITVPGFPNLFCIYGPGTNLAHAGSIIFHSECQVRYILGCIETLLEGGKTVMECRRDAYEAYNERMQETLAKTVWAIPDAGSWYKNSAGRVTTTSPWRLRDYWSWTKAPDLSDYELD